jgi:hypothetical protein
MRKILHFLLITATAVLASTAASAQNKRGQAPQGVQSARVEIDLKVNPIEVVEGVYRFLGSEIDEKGKYTGNKYFFITLEGDPLYRYFIRASWSDSLYAKQPNLATADPNDSIVVQGFGSIIIIEGSILDDQVINFLVAKKKESYAPVIKEELAEIEKYKYPACDTCKETMKEKKAREAKYEEAVAKHKKAEKARAKAILAYKNELVALQDTGLYYYSDGYGLRPREYLMKTTNSTNYQTIDGAPNKWPK